MSVARVIEEDRIVALLALEGALPALDAVVPLRPSRDSLRDALAPILGRQWADLTGTAPITREVADRDAQSVMAAILENNTHLGSTERGVRRAEAADAVLQALHVVVERSRTRERSDGTLVRLSFSADTLRDVLAELDRLRELSQGSETDIEALRARARGAASDPAKLSALRAEMEQEAARDWTPERLAALARAGSFRG